MFSEPVRTAVIGRAMPALVRVLDVPRAPLLPVRVAQPPSFATLLAGDWSIVHRRELAGRVQLEACERVAPLEQSRASRMDRQARAALELAARGVANKVIALELGISQSTVTRMIERALRTLQLADMREAMALARTEPVIVEGAPKTCQWTLDNAPRCNWMDLTAAERDIVERVMSHASRAEIARARGTSLFTVNSQIGTIFAKLRVSSKRELLQLAATRGTARG